MSERHLESAPGALGLYARAALGSIPGAGSLPFVGGGGGDEVPDTELVLTEVEVDREHLARYCRVCGFTVREALPPTYPHVLAFPLHMALLTAPEFPFAPVGLVHIQNRIVQRRPIGAAERLSIRVRATQLEPHPKGKQFSIVTEARVGEELVYEGESTNLRRGGGGDEGSGTDGSPFAGVDFEGIPKAAEWRLGGDLGRRYGAVSGDRNPIHISQWTAKPFGFPRAIAHGMWTKARALAALEGDMPDAIVVEVRFKRPILLPGRVSFASARRGGAIDFAVRDARKGTPHLEGVLAPS